MVVMVVVVVVAVVIVVVRVGGGCDVLDVLLFVIPRLYWTLWLIRKEVSAL